MVSIFEKHCPMPCPVPCPVPGSGVFVGNFRNDPDRSIVSFDHISDLEPLQNLNPIVGFVSICGKVGNGGGTLEFSNNLRDSEAIVNMVDRAISEICNVFEMMLRILLL